MERLTHLIDGLNEAIGRAASWLTLIMVLVQFALVVLRYVFGLSDRAWEELLLYFHGSLFLLAAGYTLKHNGHVRVDLLYREASPSTKAQVNIWGSLLLLVPLCTIIGWTGWSFVEVSWIAGEGSTETSGLPFKYLYKTMILVFAGLLALQAAAQIMKALLVLRGERDATEENAEEEGVVL